MERKGIASIRIAQKVYSPAKYIRETQTDVNGEFSAMVPRSSDHTRAFYIILNNPGFQGIRVENKIVPVVECLNNLSKL